MKNLNIFFYKYKKNWVGVCPQYGIVHRASYYEKCVQITMELIEESIVMDSTASGVSWVHYFRYFISKLI